MAIFGAPQKVVILCPDLWAEGWPIGGFFVDVSLSEQHEIVRNATKFPVEQGSIISDHVRREPRQLVMQCYLTDTPTDLVEAVNEAARNLQTSILQTLRAPITGPLASTRSKDMYRLLEQLAAGDALCTVATDLLVYQNMMLVRVGAPRSANDGRGLTVDMTFQRLTIARTSMREALTIDVPTEVSPAPVKNVGKTRAFVGPQPRPKTDAAELFDAL